MLTYFENKNKETKEDVMAENYCKIHGKSFEGSCADCDKGLTRIQDLVLEELFNIVGMKGKDLSDVVSRNPAQVLFPEFKFLVNAEVTTVRKSEVLNLLQGLETINKFVFNQQSCGHCGKVCSEDGCLECILDVLKTKPWEKDTNGLHNLLKQVSNMSAPLLFKQFACTVVAHFLEQTMQSEDFVGDVDDVDDKHIKRDGQYPWHEQKKSA
jgi:hypothetical protein